MRKYDVEIYSDGWWFMFPRSEEVETAVDLGFARTRAGRRVAILAAYLRQWRRHRSAKETDQP